MFRRYLTIIFPVVIFFGWYAVSAQADIAVIVQPENNTYIGEAKVKSIFLDQQRVFPSGEYAIPVNQPESSTAKNLFREKILKKALVV